jgi:hypothetical protein
MKRVLVVALLCVISSFTIFAQGATPAFDFKKGEILCAVRSDDPFGSGYYLAKVLKPATDATKGQSQMLYIGNGAKDWAHFVIASHPARKEELLVGAPAFCLVGMGENPDIGLDEYRKSEWALGHITSTDDLFKNLVEIDGNNYSVRIIRMADDPTSLETVQEE